MASSVAQVRSDDAVTKYYFDGVYLYLRLHASGTPNDYFGDAGLAIPARIGNRATMIRATWSAASGCGTDAWCQSQALADPPPRDTGVLSSPITIPSTSACPLNSTFWPLRHAAAMILSSPMAPPSAPSIPPSPHLPPQVPPSPMPPPPNPPVPPSPREPPQHPPSPIAPPPQSLLVNPGAEQGLAGWEARSGGSHGVARTTDTVARTGSNAFMFEAPAQPLLDQMVALPSGTTRILIGGWFKATPGISVGDCRLKGKIFSGAHEGWRLSIEWDSGMADWTYLSDVYEGANGLPEVQLRGGLWGGVSGSQCFMDDLELFVVNAQAEMWPPLAQPPPLPVLDSPSSPPAPSHNGPLYQNPPQPASPPSAPPPALGSCSSRCMDTTCELLRALPCAHLARAGCSCGGCCNSTYSTLPPNTCGLGTEWNDETQMCEISCSANSDGRRKMAEGGTHPADSQYFGVPVPM